MFVITIRTLVTFRPSLGIINRFHYIHEHFLPLGALENIMFSLEFPTFHTSPKILFVAWMNRFKNSFNIGKWNCSCGGVVVSEGRRETQSLEMKINASKFASLWRREVESGDCRLGGETVRVELLR